MTLQRRVRYPVAVMMMIAIAGCVGVDYQTAGRSITPREGKTLLFGRVRFFYDGSEFFPWRPAFVTRSSTERHLWLLRLDHRAVSAELHPDSDGSLAIWLAPGDYALLGSTHLPTTGLAPYEVIALFRVPVRPVAAYAGELIMSTAFHEGLHLSYSELGEKSVAVLPLDSARLMLERSLGTLPEAPVASPWCAGEDLPGFNDQRLAARAREILDRGCTRM